MSKELQKIDTTNVTNTSKRKLDMTSFNMQNFAQVMGDTELPRLFYQKVIFLLDASGSMTWNGETGKSKGEEVSDAINQVVARLKKSKNSNCFDISAYAYSSPTEHGEIIVNQNIKDITKTNFNPINYIEPKGTYLFSSFKEAIEESKEYFNEFSSKGAQSLIVILSDGGIFDYEKCLGIDFKDFTEFLTISAIYFKDSNNESDTLEEFNKTHFGENYIDEHQNILRKLCSDNSYFHSCINAEEIRKHMIKSISTISKID